MTKDERKIHERIAKVLAKAEGTNNEAEAEMLMAKVHSMLQEHNLTMVDVSKADQFDPMGNDRGVASCLVNDSWMVYVASALCKYYGAEMIYSRAGKNKKVFNIVGRESARVTSALMIPFVKNQVMQIAKRLEEEGQYRNRRIAARNVGNALASRIWKLVQQEQKKDRERVARGERALVPIDQLKAAVDHYYPNASNMGGGGVGYDSTAKNAAASISINRQTGGGSTKLLAR